RQARGSAWRERGIARRFSSEVDAGSREENASEIESQPSMKKPRRNSPGLLFCPRSYASGAGAHPHHEAVVAQFSHLIPGQRFVTERRQARIHLVEVRIGLGQIRIDAVGGI